MLPLIIGSAVRWSLRSLVVHTKNVIRTKLKKKTSQISVGSIIFCNLGVWGEHTGVYIGDGKIVHLDGSGEILQTTPYDFVRRLGGWNPSRHIFVGCGVDNYPVGTLAVATRAIEKIGCKRSYNLIFDNCHQFTAGCVTGDFENSANFKWMLNDVLEENMGVVKWCVWDTDLTKKKS